MQLHLKAAVDQCKSMLLDFLCFKKKYCMHVCMCMYVLCVYECVCIYVCMNVCACMCVCIMCVWMYVGRYCSGLQAWPQMSLPTASPHWPIFLLNKVLLLSLSSLPTVVARWGRKDTDNFFQATALQRNCIKEPQGKHTILQMMRYPDGWYYSWMRPGNLKGEECMGFASWKNVSYSQGMD